MSPLRGQATMPGQNYYTIWLKITTRFSRFGQKLLNDLVLLVIVAHLCSKFRCTYAGYRIAVVIPCILCAGKPQCQVKFSTKFISRLLRNFRNDYTIFNITARCGRRLLNDLVSLVTVAHLCSKFRCAYAVYGIAVVIPCLLCAGRPQCQVNPPTPEICCRWATVCPLVVVAFD